VDRALRLSAGQDDPILRARTRKRFFFLRLWAGGWNAQDADECEKVFTEIRNAGDRRILATHLEPYKSCATSGNLRTILTLAVDFLILLLLLRLRRTITPSWLIEVRPDQSDFYYPGR
jgi:hypothetical protein